nr:Toll/interleukin-1 receptor (TIR) domain-containing protein [Tanacetum cinerariifolium]
VPENHIPCRLGGERVHVHCKQEKRGGPQGRSVKGNREIESHRVLKKKEFCVGVERLKLLPLSYECSRLESDADDESRLLNLPPLVLEMLIMGFCAGVDYLNFRSTCKGCHLAAPLMAWNNGKASKIMQKYSLPSPWLIVFNKHKGIVTLTDPMFGNEYFMKTPQELICKFYIKCSRFGWLLILKPDGSLMLGLTGSSRGF